MTLKIIATMFALFSLPIFAVDSVEDEQQLMRDDDDCDEIKLAPSTTNAITLREAKHSAKKRWSGSFPRHVRLTAIDAAQLAQVVAPQRRDPNESDDGDCGAQLKRAFTSPGVGEQIRSMPLSGSHAVAPMNLGTRFSLSELVKIGDVASPEKPRWETLTHVQRVNAVVARRTVESKYFEALFVLASEISSTQRSSVFRNNTPARQLMEQLIAPEFADVDGLIDASWSQFEQCRFAWDDQVQSEELDHWRCAVVMSTFVDSLLSITKRAAESQLYFVLARDFLTHHYVESTCEKNQDLLISSFFLTFIGGKFLARTKVTDDITEHKKVQAIQAFIVAFANGEGRIPNPSLPHTLRSYLGVKLSKSHKAHDAKRAASAPFVLLRNEYIKSLFMANNPVD